MQKSFSKFNITIDNKDDAFKAPTDYQRDWMLDRTIRDKVDYFQSETPCWILEPDQASANYQNIARFFPTADIAYALKSNPHPALVSALHKAGANFCIVSKNHLKQLLEAGIRPEKCVYSGTIKTLDEIKFALLHKVNLFGCDSYMEVDKLAFIRNALGSSQCIEVFIRLEVEDTGSIVPMSGKFGVEPGCALDIMHYARQKGLTPIGFTFHVGSQCQSLETWEKAIQTVSTIWASARETFNVDFLNLGGGLAVHYENSQEPSLAQVSENVYQAIDKHLVGLQRLVVEPGRAISATAASMLTSVTGLAIRPDGKTWAYVDAGVYSGLFETVDSIYYPVTVLPSVADNQQSNFKKYCQHKESYQAKTDDGRYAYMLAGPTCDSFDKLYTITTSQPINVGDRLLFNNTGAYGYSLESSFNGYTAPVIQIADQRVQHRVASQC